MAGSKLKIIGTILELEFATECIRRGAVVSQPFGDNSHYDFLVDCGKGIFKVQVKAASVKPGEKAYSVNLTRKLPKMRPGDLGGSSKSVPYEKGALDCIVTCAEGVWFFFNDPHSLTANESVYPKSDAKAYKGNRGREQWELIGLKSEAVASDTIKVEDILEEIAAETEMVDSDTSKPTSEI
jgi:hypothetical protein